MTDKPILIEVDKLGISTYTIYQNWYKMIVRPTGKPYYEAIAVLAEVVSWYSPEYQYDRQGRLIHVGSRFEGPYLAQNYEQFSELLNLSKRDVIRAVVHLEKFGLLMRHFYNKIDEQTNLLQTNNLMLELIPERLYEITRGSILQEHDSP